MAASKIRVEEIHGQLINKDVYYPAIRNISLNRDRLVIRPDSEYTTQE